MFRRIGLVAKHDDASVRGALDAALAVLGRYAVDIVVDAGVAAAVDGRHRVGADEAHLVIFDRDPTRSWEDKLWRRREAYGERFILIWGC